MKKINIIAQIIFLLVIFTSCNGLLNTKPLDKYTEDVIWNDKSLAQSTIYTFYSDILKEYIMVPNEVATFYGAGLEDYSDNTIIKENRAYSYNSNTATSDTDFGWNKFNLIREANLVIERATESEGISESDKKEMIAQGKMLRALVYAKAARVFGRYIIVDKVLTVEDSLNIPRTTTIKETYDFIIKDLQEASVDLNESAVNGHFTKGSALALLSEVALQGAAYSESGQDEYYAIAKKACEDIFALGKYSLDDNYYKIFNDFDYAGTSNEIIFARWRTSDVTQFSKTPVIKLYPNGEVSKIKDGATPIYENDFLGWFGRMPSQEIVNAYEVIDADGVAKKWNETSYYESYLAGKTYASKVLFYNKDARFEASIVHDSTWIGGNLWMSRINGSSHYAATSKDYVSRSFTGYTYRKATNDVDFVQGPLYTNYHHVLFRLGRVYLNYAEAMLRTNNIATAIEYINKTRTKHGGLPALSTTLSNDEAWEAYKNERRVELYMEGDRFWSLLRWYKADGEKFIPELNGIGKYYEISEDGKTFEEKDLYSIVNSLNVKVWNERKFLFPVPKSYIDLSGGVIDQNPGW